MIVRETTSPTFLADATLPVIGYDNFVDISNIEATVEDVNFPATNLGNQSTHLRWQEPDSSPISAADVYITVSIPADVSVSPAIQESISYLAIAEHNFGSLGCVVSVESTTDASSPISGYATVVSYSPTDDQPIIFQFEPRQPTFIRLKITAGSALRRLAILYVGQILTLERGVKAETTHTPINLGRLSNVISGFSESGNFLGRIVRNNVNESKAEFMHFTPAWYRANFDPFLIMAQAHPFFWAWDPNGNPGDTGFAWLTKDAIPEFSPVTGRFNITLEMRAIATRRSPHVVPVSPPTPAFDPLTLFSGVSVGGLYLASTVGNTINTWNDSSGLGNHLTQTSTDRFDALVTGFNGNKCYRTSVLGGAGFWDLPGGFALDRKSFSFWGIFRSRSMPDFSSRAIFSLNGGSTDCMAEFSIINGTNSLAGRIWGTSQQDTTIHGSSSVGLVIVTSDTGETKFIYNGETFTGSAFSVGTMTGGVVWHRGDGYPIAGEAYECGFIDRPLTADEIISLKSRFTDLYRPLFTSKQLVIAGDSITEGQAATSATMGWPCIVDDQLGDTWTQWSVAAGGTQAANFATRDNTDLYDGSSTKNVLVYWLGTNDIHDGNSAADTLTAIRAYTDPMRAVGYKVIVCTVIKRVDIIGAAETQRTTLNTNILADANFDATVDLASMTEFSNTADTTYYNGDGIHLNDTGMAVVANAVKPVILAQ